MHQNFCIIIPSRIGSTRLKNKPLIDLHGQSLIQRVYENALLITSKSYIATDSVQIKDSLKDITKNVVMTSKDHISGTDRICEAAKKLKINDDTLILNLQGDEPFIPKDLLLKVIDDFFLFSCDVITVSNQLTSDDDLNNPNCVSVEVDSKNYATKFSRLEKLNNPKRHVGIYGYSFKISQIFFVQSAISFRDLMKICRNFMSMLKHVKTHYFFGKSSEKLRNVQKIP